MASDPRKWLGTNCTKDKVALAQTTATKKSFLDGLSNVGALEVLNDIGLSEVGEGLRVLTGVSDTIRLDGKIPTFLSNAATDANEVLKECGIDLNAIPTILDFNPEVANRALGQAKAIADRIKAGNFTIKDIPKSVAEIQNLSELINKIYVPAKAGPTAKLRELCGASPYARDLIAYAPKFKFMFFVQITYHPRYQHLDEWGRKTAFVVKNSTRPNVEFEYEEVNMYNFWTKIPKRTIYQPMTMRFYDDNKNSANYFYNSYLRAMSPIANKGGHDWKYIDPEFYQKGSMYDDGDYTASLGPLDDNAPNLISSIQLYHIYGYGQWLNIYTFYNPKITNLELDDLDMADSGAGSEMSFQFAYDGLHVESAIHTQTLGLNNLKDYTGDGVGAKYPIIPVFESGDAGDAAAAAGGGGGSVNLDRVATSFENMATDPTAGVGAPDLDATNDAFQNMATDPTEGSVDIDAVNASFQNAATEKIKVL